MTSGPEVTSWTAPPLPARIAASRNLALVGRRLELETLERCWDEVLCARRQVVFLGGEPGVGKTRILAEVAGALHDSGATVLVGTCSADRGISYEPFIEVLDHLFGTAATGALAGLVPERGDELARLSAQVARHRPELVDHHLGESEARIALFDAAAGLFRALAARQPLALVLDDLHWAHAPTLALLEHIVEACPEIRLLVLGTFRTTAPDRSEDLASHIAELHRLEGVRRLDLAGLDTDAIAEYVSLRSGLPVERVRAPAALLRERTGGNAFFLRELWGDLERRGGVSALRLQQGVPASVGDTLSARVASLGDDARKVVELAAVLGDTFDLATLVAASESDGPETMAFVDAAMAVGLIDRAGQDDNPSYAFVHALTRQAVLDRMAQSRRSLLHARAGEALERQPPDAARVTRLASHYLAAHLLGHHDKALRYCAQAAALAARSLAFEDAALWYERAASLPECEVTVRDEMLLAAAMNEIRACHFPRAREIYERLGGTADPAVRLSAAVGFEEATWRPGLSGPRAADLLSAALDECGLDERDANYVGALASLGRALALAGESDRARQVGKRAIELARELDDPATLVHALEASMWEGTSPDLADAQLERSTEMQRVAMERRDYELLGAAANFKATVSYLCGRWDDLEGAVTDARRTVEATRQPYYRHLHCCLAHAQAFLHGDFDDAERWAEEMLRLNATLGGDMADGPYGVQMYMVRRETGALEALRPLFDGSEAFAGRWTPGLLALYTELGIEIGVRRALDHLGSQDLGSRAEGAQWPMELVFMTEGALEVEDASMLGVLRPLLGRYEGMNLVSGTMIAVFGSCDRYLARIAALEGDDAEAERRFATALTLDRATRSRVHTAETLAHYARFSARVGQPARAREMATEARAIAERIGQRRVLRLIDSTEPARAPDGLTERELAVLRLLATGLSNHEIGVELHISGNTAANHVRAILMKTGAANRTQAAIYAAHKQLV